jgi:hypothetical protein
MVSTFFASEQIVKNPEGNAQPFRHPGWNKIFDSHFCSFLKTGDCRINAAEIVSAATRGS